MPTSMEVAYIMNKIKIILLKFKNLLDLKKLESHLYTNHIYWPFWVSGKWPKDCKPH